jgi:hypothetical protein
VSDIIDMFCYNSLEFISTVGVSEPGAPYAVTIDHGDDEALADAAPVPADSLLGTLADASWVGGPGGDNIARRIGYIGKKRYVRYTITPTGNVGTNFGVVAVQGVPAHAPTPVSE